MQTALCISSGLPDTSSMSKLARLVLDFSSSRLRVLVSVSGGRSSMYMAHRLATEYADVYDMQFVFANTGAEHESTLRFVHECEVRWQMPITWVEAVFHGHGVGTTHRVVSFDTASRNGQPFHDMCAKLGIPNVNFPFCTRELKLRPITSFIRDEVGWGTRYATAIGIRADEPKRLRSDATEACVIYPLASLFPTTKAEINDWWNDQPFDLEIPDILGNCTWCWKKSLRKLIAVAADDPEWFSLPDRLEQQYGLVSPPSRPNKPTSSMVFFRGSRSASDIIAISRITGNRQFGNTDPDENSGCSESCEVF